MGRTRQMINKEKEVLNNTKVLNKPQLDPTHLWIICIQHSRIHILFKCTWNILQDKSYIRPQNKPSINLKVLKQYKVCSPTTMELNQKPVTEGNLGNSKICEN